MSQEEFRQQLANATKIVETWPAWKQQILESYSSPTVSVPRTPIEVGQEPKSEQQGKKVAH